MASAPGEESQYVEGPRHAVITTDDVGPVITIITLFLMVIMILAVALRLLVRFTTSRVPGYDDAVISIALVIALGEVISTCLTVNDGLGTRRTLLSEEQWMKVEKGLFASALLYILTISLAKLSTLLLLHRLTVSTRHKLTVRILTGFMIAWALAAIFGIAFGCNLPDPWDVGPSRCFDVISFWDAIGTLDILLDVFLIAMPAWLVWTLQMPFARKAIVIFGFAFRIVLIAAQITRLVYLNKFSSRDNGVQSTLGYILASQFETLFAVVVACVPAYRPFMEAAASGLIGISFRDRKGTYELSSVNNANGGVLGQPQKDKTPDRSKNSQNASRSRSKAHIFDAEGVQQAEIHAASRKNSRANALDVDGSGGSGSNHSGVQKTVEWDVQWSDEARLNQRQGWSSSSKSGRDHELESVPPGSSSTKRDLHDML